jgi:hypothetical protein
VTDGIEIYQKNKADGTFGFRHWKGGEIINVRYAWPLDETVTRARAYASLFDGAYRVKMPRGAA